LLPRPEGQEQPGYHVPNNRRELPPPHAVTLREMANCEHNISSARPLPSFGGQLVHLGRAKTAQRPQRLERPSPSSPRRSAS
jgi:hypothetical protein